MCNERQLLLHKNFKFWGLTWWNSLVRPPPAESASNMGLNLSYNCRNPPRLRLQQRLAHVLGPLTQEGDPGAAPAPSYRLPQIWLLWSFGRVGGSGGQNRFLNRSLCITLPFWYKNKEIFQKPKEFNFYHSSHLKILNVF